MPTKTRVYGAFLAAACLVDVLRAAPPGQAQSELDCAAGAPCRTAERERFEAQWEGQQARIEAKYRAVLSDFERRCRAIISRARRGPLRAVS